MTRKRQMRDPNTWTVVRLPERDLAESILHLVQPLLEPLGPVPAPDETRRALALAVELWNAHVCASEFWGDPQPKPLAQLRKAMCGKQAPRGLADTFALLSARWRRGFNMDPRLVGSWSFEAGPDGRPRLVCQTTLPDGVRAEVPPSPERRICVSGRFLDEVQIRLAATSYPNTTAYLRFPEGRHRAEVAADGAVTIHAQMPAALQLFAEGRLPPVGGPPVDVGVGGRKPVPMVLRDVICADEGGHHDVALLVFRPA